MGKKKLKKRFKSPKFLIPVGITLVLMVGYLFLCIIAGGDAFYSNITINGIDVSGMTTAQATTALETQYQKDCQNVSFKLEANDKTYTVSMKDNLAFNASEESKRIFDELNGNFLLRGYRYLMGADFNAAVTVKDNAVLDQSLVDSKVSELDTKIDTTYKLDGDKIVFTKGKTGKKVDLDDIKDQIELALKNYDFDKVIQGKMVNSKPSELNIESVHEEICHEMVNATLDRNNNYAIVESRVGVDFDLETAKKMFNDAAEGTSVNVPATITQPKVTTESLRDNLFKDTLGSYTTSVSGTSVRRNNVKLAGNYCSGTILLPGEEFSYNNVVGERTEARGFGAAGAYVAGETVDVVGGGVCQPSSTLYNAVMLANLEVTERSPHSYVSGYVPIGRDAMVSWGSSDFKFKNTTDYPIKVVSSYSNHRLTMKIMGTNLENITVKITSERLSSKPYTTKEIQDSTLEVGKRVVETSGYTGATAQSYRYVYKDGVLIKSGKEAYSSYKTRTEVVRVGTKPVTPTTPTTPTTPDTGTTTPTTPDTDTTTQTN